jgi:DNA polymerase III gamma/tau subunit
MSLYQKYRPLSLDQIKGNSDLISTLKSMLSNLDTCPHVFLLHGPKGCGKTTIGRIIATNVGCKGNDFVEVNASNNRGIDTIREIIKNAQFQPLEGQSRAWLIDEAHRCTGEFQDASLKILEDTPKHVYFILCTTEPEKLKKTVKDRCQIFQVNPLNDSQIISLLRGVVRGEGQTLDKGIYERIAQDGLGHPRNALQILEQVLNSPSERRLEIAKQTLLEESQSIELCRALMKNRVHWNEVTQILKGLKDQEPEGIRRHILGYCQSVLLNGENDRAAFIIETFYDPLYDIGWPGLVYCCYSIIKN